MPPTKHRYCLFVLIISLLNCCAILAQSPRFQRIDATNGLSQSEVYAILEDSRGFMWFGTVDGLNRYDGHEITVFHTDRNDQNTLSNGTIRSLCEDNEGRIWIGTDDGLCVYDLETELIHRIPLPATRKTMFSILALQIQGKYLWIGSRSGLLRTRIDLRDLDLVKRGFHYIDYQDHPNRPSPAQLHLSMLCPSTDGGIWIGGSNFIKKIIVPENTAKAITLAEVPTQEAPGYKKMQEDPHGQLWATKQGKGLLRFDERTGVARNYRSGDGSNLSSDFCSSVVIDKVGNIWIGTLDKGLNYLPSAQATEAQPAFINLSANPLDGDALSTNLIFSLYASRNNLLWVGTIGHGVNVYSPHQKAFSHHQIPPTDNSYPSNFIRSVFGTGEEVFVGTHNNGLFKMDRTDGTFSKVGFGTQPIYHLNSYFDDELLVCGGNGLTVLKHNGKSYIPAQNFPKKTAFYVVQSREDVYWTATYNGIERYERIKGRYRRTNELSPTTVPAISFSNVRVLYYDEQQNVLWAGTEGGGLNRVELDHHHQPVAVTIYGKDRERNQLSSNYIRAIEPAADGSLWVGTYEGLNQIIDPGQSSERINIYDKRDGLPNNMIELLEMDKVGHLWIGTNSGLIRMNPTDKTFRVYSKSDGLQASEFSEHTSFEMPCGELLIGGVDGINIFNPEEIINSPLKPKTTITGFTLFNESVIVGKAYGGRQVLAKSITTTDSIFLKPGQNSFGFTFSGVQYPEKEKTHYAYRLVGYENNWVTVDNRQRTANFTNLSPGRYEFQVKSTNADGILEETPRRVYLHLQTPWYKTWWACTIYALAFIGLVVYFATYSVIRITDKKKMLLHHEASKKMRELNKMRDRFFTNISHDLRTSLTLISSPVEELLRNSDLAVGTRSHLELVNRNVRRLQTFSEQLLDDRKAEKGKLAIQLFTNDLIDFIYNEVECFQHTASEKGLKLAIHSDRQELVVAFDPNVIAKVMLNLLFNAIKFTDSGRIDVRLVTSEKTVRVEVSDTGRGIPQEKIDQVFTRYFQHGDSNGEGYGIGLSLCKNLVRAHGGEIWLSQRSEGGSSFYFTIPIIKKEYPALHKEPTLPEIVAPGLTGPANKDVTQASVLSENRETILIIEDNQDMRRYLVEVFRTKYNVLSARNGKEGLLLATQEMPGLILSDIMMPEMDGLQFCEAIRGNFQTSHIPIILLTALVNDEAKYRGIDRGADEYILKPFKINYLELRVSKLLESRQQLREAFSGPYELNPGEVTVTNLDEVFLTELLEKLEAHIPDSDFSINKLEADMGMSHANFYRKVKALTNLSGKEILQSLRMKRAMQLFENEPGLRVSEVAYMVGFTNPKYFSRCFKEAHQVTPSQVKARVEM